MERIMVQRQWFAIYGVHDDRVRFSTAVWKDFFKRNKDEVARFSRVNGGNIYSSEFRAHMVRVFAGLDIIISSLPNEPVFQSVLEHYHNFHGAKGVTKDLVKKFGYSMGNVLPDFLDETYAADAWGSCISVIADGIAV